MIFLKTATTLCVIFTMACAIPAAIIPNSLFSDNAVLQRNQPLSVWGTAKTGEKVSVEFAGQIVSSVAKDGKWLIRLKPLQPGGPFTLTITSDDSSLTLTNIL